MTKLSSAQQKGDGQYGFFFDQRRCTGCKTCEVACKDYHDLPGELAFRTIIEYTGGSWQPIDEGAWTQNVFCYHISTSCNHCSNPVCMRFCTNGAISKGEGGMVVIDGSLCVGCQSCVIACPYHAPRFDYVRGIAVKCNGCIERLREGRTSVCVDACPQRALSLALYADLIEDPDVVSAVAPLPSPDFTQPNFVMRPCKEARPLGDHEGHISNPREA